MRAAGLPASWRYHSIEMVRFRVQAAGFRSQAAGTRGWELGIKSDVLAVARRGRVFWSTDFGFSVMRPHGSGVRFRYLVCSIDFTGRQGRQPIRATARAPVGRCRVQTTGFRSQAAGTRGLGVGHQEGRFGSFEVWASFWSTELSLSVMRPHGLGVRFRYLVCSIDFIGRQGRQPIRATARLKWPAPVDRAAGRQPVGATAPPKWSAPVGRAAGPPADWSYRSAEVVRSRWSLPSAGGRLQESGIGSWASSRTFWQFRGVGEFLVNRFRVFHFAGTVLHYLFHIFCCEH